MKKIFLFLTMILVALAAFSCDTNDESYYLYDLNNDGPVTIMGVSETYSKELEIPKTIDGKTVTAIGDYAFYNNQYIREITLPDTVITIGQCAFADSLNLVSINIGKECQVIGLQAFEGCSSLETITLSKALIRIEDLAFSGCTLLKSFDPPSTLETLGIDVFDECEQLVINSEGCPAIEKYAEEYKIPTGFSETDDFQLLKIIILTATALIAILVLRYVIKKIKKKNV